MPVFCHDIAFAEVVGSCPDMIIENGDLKPEKGLETAILITLFSDKRATDDQLPDGITGKRGWWGDTIAEIASDQIGSLLWTTERNKVTLDTANKMADAVRDSLDWLFEDGVISDANVSSEITGPNDILITLELIMPEGDDFTFKFAWDGQEFKVAQTI